MSATPPAHLGEARLQGEHEGGDDDIVLARGEDHVPPAVSRGDPVGDDLLGEVAVACRKVVRSSEVRGQEEATGGDGDGKIAPGQVVIVVGDGNGDDEAGNTGWVCGEGGRGLGTSLGDGLGNQLEGVSLFVLVGEDFEGERGDIVVEVKWGKGCVGAKWRRGGRNACDGGLEDWGVCLRRQGGVVQC